MEQTLMTNAIKKRLNRKGFTLAEVLVTVAIILILAGVTFVSVAQYQKNLRLMEMDGTAKEIFIAAQNHLSVAKASGDLDRLAEDAKKPGSAPSTIGTKLDLTAVSAYAGNADGEYYSVIHNVTSGSESCTPSGSDTILGMMLPFGALDETVASGGNYAIVYELKSASVVAVLYSGAGNASFGNATVINLEANDVNEIPTLYNDKSARKSYKKGGVTAIVGCYTGTAGSAAIPTETLEAPKLEVKNENKLHVIVSGNYSAKDVISLTIHGVQSDTTAIMQLNCKDSGGNTFDVTLDDITVNLSTGKNLRFTEILSEGRFTRSDATSGKAFIPGENIEISATARATDALATPKTSAVYTTSSLFADANDGRTVYIKNLRHLENLSVDMSDFTGELKDQSGSTDGNIHAIQKNDITMLSSDGLCGFDTSSNKLNIYGSGTIGGMYIAANVDYPLSYDGGSHEIHDLSIAPYSGGSGKELNAGIFGNVTKTLSVKNLILRNDKIPDVANATNAGMLLGKTSANLTVDGVLAYYHENEYSAERDAAVEVQAKQVAGGLIGLVAGGKLDVKNSAAAVYVKGVTAAGGLIGSVSGAAEGSTIVQSYAGGHTRDGAYSTTDAATNQSVLTGEGRYNVQATQASGYAGGFIGVTTNNVSMNAVYSTASAYSSSGEAYSNSFAGSGTPNIQATADGKKNYYAIGPHNGTDAFADDTVKAEIQTGQVRRQATPYDRKILKDDASEKTMKKMTYPLCTISHMCSDTNLPWFIKEHVGDWVVSKKIEEPNFEVENGNRLTVRINTGMQSISDDLYYVVKVNGITSNMEVYFLIHADKTGQCIVKRSYDIKNFNKQQDNPQLLNQPSICSIQSVAGAKSIEFYLDDITNSNGNFNALCPGLYAGEDIEVNVVPIAKITDVNTTSFDITKSIKTNSLFGYLDKKDSQKKDEHNEQKIYAVQQYNTNAGNEGMGVVPDGNGHYYVQIDNSRHLENLAAGISNYPWSGTVGNQIIGAIQTDDIYWSGNSTAYTISFTEELGRNLSVYSNKTIKSRDGHFSPIDYCANVVTYDGSNHKIDGFSVEENGLAGLFSQPQSEITIKNLKVNNSSFISSGGRAGGLMGENDKHTTIENVSITNTVVQGSGTSGGFVGFSNNGITITNSIFDYVKVTSTTDAAGGFVGYTGGAETNIKNVSCDGGMIVKGKNASGGIIGQTNQFKVTVDGTKFLSEVEVTSENTHAGGVIGDAGGETEIKNTIFNSILTVSGDNSSGGIIGNTYVKATIDGANFQSDVTVTSQNDHAAGVLGITNNEADIENITFINKLIVLGNKSSGGILGNSGNKLKLWNISIGGPSTITSFDWDAGGVVGYAQSSDADIQNVKFIGKDTEIIAKQNAGGLCGTLTGNGSQLIISNIAVSAFIQAKENAGGLIGRLQTSASEGKIEKSYYGGRTKGGQYASITINNNTKEYKSNIHGSQKAGGLIGYIENTYGLTIDKCFSTGSVENGADNQIAGGFIGATEQSNVNVKNCYSIGKVDNQNKGGFIGYRINSNLSYENARYLSTFNDPSVKAIGNGSDDENNNLTTKYADDVLGKNETSDQTVQTNYYDDALKGEIYPYKNWTTDWKADGATETTPIAYYGDWPLLKLNGSFVYFDAIDKNKDNYENGGRFNIYSYEKDMNTTLIPFKTKLKSSGFGIISDVNKYDELANFYLWSYKIDANDKEKMPCKIEGSEEKDGEHKGEVSKYSKFSYLGKEFYFYRCTFEGLENLKDGTIFVWAEKGPNKGAVYKVDIHDNKVSFELHSNPNSTLNP